MRPESRPLGFSRCLAVVAVLAAGMAAAPAIAGDADVAAAQRALKAIGYDAGVPDGVVGRRTRDALREFQQAAGLPVTGELDEATKGRLASIGPAAAEPKPAPVPAVPEAPRAVSETVVPPTRMTPSTPETAPSSSTPALQRAADPVPSSPPPAQSQGSGTIIALLLLGGGAWLLLRRRKRRPTGGTVALPAASAAPPARPAPVSPPPVRRAPPPAPWQTPVAPSFAGSSPLGRDCWLPAGRSVTIAGHVIDGGLLYVGRSPGSAAWGEDNCVIDPTLPVAASKPDTAGASVPYYPSYRQITPQVRLAYLLWLASGRRDPAANVGYVFLYFYGLERRLIVDRSQGEAAAIVAELGRLLSIYGGNNSFVRYAGELLDAARLLYGGDSLDEHPPTGQGPSWELPMALRVALGRRVAAGKPLTAEWMLAWLQADPETRLRTPARRAAAEFRALFAIRFEAKHPGGLMVKPPKSRLKSMYRMASGYQQVPLLIGDVPDVATIRGPLNQAQAIAEACTDALDAYSRFLGRNPDKAASLEAALLLPPEIRATSQSEALRRATAWLGTVLTEGDAAVAPGKELLERLGFEAGSKLNRRDSGRLVEALRGFGVGLEPNPAFGTGVVAPEEPVALFRLPADAAATPSDAYGGMWLLIGLAAAVALADGTLGPEEERALLGRIDAAHHLPEAERIRLKAHVRRLERTPSDLSSLRSRLAGLPETERRDVGRFAAGMAAADGRVDPAEVRALERIYAMLGLDKSLVFSDLHAETGAAATPAADDPVPVAAGGRPAPGHRIPPLPKPAAPDGIALDPERLGRIFAETHRVSAVLGAVFEEETVAEAEPDPASNETEDEAADELAGLDRHHQALVDRLLPREEWPREDFDRLARSVDLLPDGALETINEWAFDRFGEALVDDGEPLVVNRNLIPTRTREAA